MENTLQFGDYKNINTIPEVCEMNSAHLRKASFSVNDEIEGYQLLSLITCTINSEVWYCSDFGGFRCVIKITNTIPDIDTIQRIRELDCENLVPILDCGITNSLWFEVYPFYKNGNLRGPIQIDILRNNVLPGIIKALDAIHQQEIIHNDIKPSNLYWDDAMEKVLLGDFGSALPAKQKPNGLTIAYAAPELLLNDVCRRASDWGAVGLTLATILDGKEIISADSIQGAIRIWEKGVRFSNSDFSLQQLINGMLIIEPRKRLGPNAAKKWCGNSSFGGEERSTCSHGREQSVLTVTFNNPPWIAADIEGLLKGIEEHWDYSSFLFKQSKMDRFLSQFDKEYVSICREYRKMANSEDALYRLTLVLSDNQSYIWRGKRYYNLSEMEETWEKDEIGEKDICSFLQRGHVSYYLKKTGALEEKIEFVMRLQNISKVHPFEACAQLFQALRGDDGLNWGDFVLNDLNDIVTWLKTKENDLDVAIDQFFESKKFEAWFAYQGMNDVLEDIRRKCEI